MRSRHPPRAAGTTNIEGAGMNLEAADGYMNINARRDPHFVAHTREVLAELGLAPADVAALETAGTVRAPAGIGQR